MKLFTRQVFKSTKAYKKIDETTIKTERAISSEFKYALGCASIGGTIGGCTAFYTIDDNKNDNAIFDYLVLLPIYTPVGIIVGGIAGFITGFTWPITLPIFLYFNRKKT